MSGPADFFRHPTELNDPDTKIPRARTRTRLFFMSSAFFRRLAGDHPVYSIDRRARPLLPVQLAGNARRKFSSMIFFAFLAFPTCPAYLAGLM
jgi:hypothetical protein